MKPLALFDFDGTITYKDTLFDIASYSSSGLIYWLKIGLLLPSFVLMKVGLLSKQKGKELFLKAFFSKLSEKEFNGLCESYCKERLPHVIRPKALKQIEEFQSGNVDVYIVSASAKNWITPWADGLGIKVLSTELIFENGGFTGKIKGINCNGKEKVARIKKSINLKEYGEIFAFGDTKGDLPMLALATKKHYKPFT